MPLTTPRPLLTPRRARVLAAAIAVVGVGAAVVAVRVGGDPDQVLGRSEQRITPAADAPQAPELSGITGYADGTPVTLQQLRGKVVLLDFWTSTCINCLRTFPELHALQDAYGPSGFQVVGVHSPEFAFEKSHDNVVAAVRRLGVTWPVAEDPGLSTFSAYGNQYWPTSYVLDRQGRIRLGTIGEGGAERIEQAVRTLLAEGGTVPEATASFAPDDAGAARSITPETYFWGRDPQQFADATPVAAGAPVTRSDPPQLRDVLRLVGRFRSDGESLSPLAGASFTQGVRARDVYVTAAGRGPLLDVTVDGAPVPAAQRGPDLRVVGGRTVLLLDGSRLYHLLTGPQVRLATLGLTARAPGAQLFTLTYGG